MDGHARRVLVEAAWTYRFPARKSAHLQRKAEKTSEVVQAIAWKAQKRLCHRDQAHLVRGKMKVQACTAIARELSGFIWAIVREVLEEHRVGIPTTASAQEQLQIRACKRRGRKKIARLGQGRREPVRRTLESPKRRL